MAEELKTDITLESSESLAEPKRFIRTLESDLAALKGGTSPDFTERESSAPPLKAPDPLPAVTLTGLPAEGVVLPVTPPPTLPQERLVAASPVIEEIVVPPEPEKIVPPPPPPIPKTESKKEEPAPVIHTYTSDFSDQMKTADASSASILAAEGDAPASKNKPHQKANTSFVVGGVLLLFLGVGGAFAAYWVTTHPSTGPVVVTPPLKAPIFVDEREEISGSQLELLTAFKASLEEPLPTNAVRYLYTTESVRGTKSVFSALSFRSPAILFRNVNPEGGMAGIIAQGGTPSPFFIISVRSYGDTFAGMLAWEKTMPADLAVLFPHMPLATSTLSIASTTPEVNPILSKFRDEVISNHDVRVLRDSAGKGVIVYGYWSPNTLILTGTEAAFSEIIARLSTSRTQNEE